ncbi:hypothetical protein PtrSN002B_012167, partial [Pyrenophora tritici-repentis]
MDTWGAGYGGTLGGLDGRAYGVNGDGRADLASTGVADAAHGTPSGALAEGGGFPFSASNAGQRSVDTCDRGRKGSVDRSANNNMHHVRAGDSAVRWDRGLSSVLGEVSERWNITSLDSDGVERLFDLMLRKVDLAEIVFVRAYLNS